MSDAPEAGNSGVKFSRTEVSNHLANGQSCISESFDTSSQLGPKIGVKLGDTAALVGSEIFPPNVIEESLQGQMEARNTPPLSNSSNNAPTKMNSLTSTIPGQGYREGRLTPNKMQVKAPSPSLPVNASTEAMNSNLLQSGLLEENSHIPYSNGPPTNPIDYKPAISQLDSTQSVESQALSAATLAPYQKSSPLSSNPATSEDSSGHKLAPVLSGPHQVDSSPLHAPSDRSLPSSSSPQPRPSPSQSLPQSSSAQQFPHLNSSQPMTTIVQSTASFTSVESSASSSMPSRPQAYSQRLGETSQFPMPSKISQGPFQSQIPSSNQMLQYTNSQQQQMSQQPHFPGYISQNPGSGQISQPAPGTQMLQSPAPVQSLPTGQLSQQQFQNSHSSGQRPPFPASNQIPQPPFTGQITRFSSPNQISQSSPAGPKFTNPYNPPLPQPQPLPPTSSATPGIPGSFPSPPSSYQVPPHSSQNFPQPAMQTPSQRPGAPGPFPSNNLPRQAFPPNSQHGGPGVFFPPNQQPPMPPIPNQMQAQQPTMPPLPNQTQPQQALMPPIPNQTQPQQPPMPPLPNKAQSQQPPMPPIPNQTQLQQPPMPTFPNQMPPQQTPMPYAQRPPPPVTSQPSSWAQANGIPNRMPQFDTTNRQQMPGSMPMYPQGSQDMPQNTQVTAMGGNVQQQMPNDPSQMSRRYPQQAGYQQYPSGTSVGNSNSAERMSSQFRNLSVTRDGFNKLWGADCYDLLQTRTILPAERVEPPKIQLHQDFLDGVNCRPEIFRCTLTKIPESNSLLQKSRLPLGILIHPFKDINNLPVVQCNTIVRCRSCRTYINPFVYFVDHRRWKCNLCFRVNDMPEEFQFDPVTKTFGDPSRRPEIRSSTIEYIAPSEYMLRPPQAAVYLFLLDVSCGAIEQGYLSTVCDVLSEELSQLPGDSRTQIGFIAFDSSLHFFALAEGLTQPQHMVISDIEEVFLPRPDNLLVNLQECKDLVQDLLAQLPTTFLNTHDTGSALGPALQAAHKLMAPTGGRVTVFQTCLPTVGPGALKVRGDSGAKEASAQQLQAATDFYKRLALDCSGHQVAVDLFVLGNRYTDLATLSGVSQFSGGCIHHLPHFDGRNNFESGKLERSFHRYLSRKIGFEAVMRIRCSRGLSIHTFHGHFFVRSTDLLSLPNVNPDAGFGMQVAIDESLSDLQNVCFQAALLYTSSKGERRIRVHTLCLPIAANVNDVVCSADQQCIIGLLAKMAVDRSLQSSPADARDAFINVATDVLSTYRLTQSIGPSSGLLSPHSLRLLPLYILALLKHAAFRSGQGTRLDDRVFAMCQMKTLPLSFLMQEVYPDLYPIHDLHEQMSFKNSEGQVVPNPARLHLSAEKLDSRGVFLLDRVDIILIYVGRLVAPQFCQDAFGVPHFAAIQDDMYEIPVLSTSASELLNNFVRHLQSEKPYEAAIQVIREDSRHRMQFIEKLVEDRSESALSYYEFLQHLKAQVK